jgi:hypothetical protein
MREIVDINVFSKRHNIRRFMFQIMPTGGANIQIVLSSKCAKMLRAPPSLQTIAILFQLCVQPCRHSPHVATSTISQIIYSWSFKIL